MYTCHKEERDSFISKFGEKEFERVCVEDKTWAKLQDIEIPPEYSWLFEQFLNMWWSCERDFNGNVIFRPKDILDYEIFIGIQFTYKERGLLLQMKYWAAETVYEVKEQ